MFRLCHDLKGSPEQIADGLRTAEETMLPWLHEEMGYRGFMTFVDRGGGRGLAISPLEGGTVLAASRQRHRRPARPARPTSANRFRFVFIVVLLSLWASLGRPAAERHAQ